MAPLGGLVGVLALRIPVEPVSPRNADRSAQVAGGPAVASQSHSITALTTDSSYGIGAVIIGPATIAFGAAVRRRRHHRIRHRCGHETYRRATEVEMETTTNLAPWELDEETEDEKQSRYKREADEMKMKWDARRLEEKQSAARRRAWTAKEQERAALYGARDLIMEAYESRIYEEARVIEVRRRQREVYERIKAYKRGDPLPPKGEPYVPLRPPPVRPPAPEDFDVSGRYDEDAEAADLIYRAPDNFKSPSGERPPARHLRGAPRAAWESPPYGPPPRNRLPQTGPTGPSPKAAPPLAPPPQASPRASPPQAPPRAPPTAKRVPEAKKPVEEDAELTLPTVEEVDGMKVAELRAACKQANLTASGKKAELVERLKNAINK